MYVLIHSICFSLSDFFHSIWPFLGPSMSLQIAPFRSFSRLSSIPSCICTTASLPIPLLRNVFCLFFNLRLVALALRAVSRQKLERLSRDVWWKPDGQEHEHREKILSSSCSDGKLLHWELQWYNIENIPDEMVHLTMEISWLRILSVHVFLLGVVTRYLQRLEREREKKELKRNCFSFSFKGLPWQLLFTAVWGSQQNWEEGTEISHPLPAPTHAQPTPLSTFPTRGVHFLHWWTSIDTSLSQSP